MKKSIIASIILSTLSGYALADASHENGQDEHALTTSFMYQGKAATEATKAYLITHKAQPCSNSIVA